MKTKVETFYFSGHYRTVTGRVKFADRAPIHGIGLVFGGGVLEPATLKQLNADWISDRSGWTIDGSQFPGCQLC